MHYGKRNPYDLEEGRPSSSFTSEIAEQENERALGDLEEKARLIKQLTRDIHGEVESQNKFLDNLGFEMESAKRLLSGTVDKFMKVFETKSSKSWALITFSSVTLFTLLYFFTRR